MWSYYYQLVWAEIAENDDKVRKDGNTKPSNPPQYYFPNIFFLCPEYLDSQNSDLACTIFINQSQLSIFPSVQSSNLFFRVCVMCLRTTTESSGGNRLALCCSPTLTWYDPALSPCSWVCMHCGHTLLTTRATCPQTVTLLPNLTFINQ